MVNSFPLARNVSAPNSVIYEVVSVVRLLAFSARAFALSRLPLFATV
jgi:hypothetical protein